MNRQMHMDNCVTTPLAPEVLEAMQPYFSKSFGIPPPL